MFVRKLLRRVSTDRHQTLQAGRESYYKMTMSFMPKSQGGHPIGKVLVMSIQLHTNDKSSSKWRKMKVLNWIGHLYELELTFFFMDELELKYSPVHGNT